MVKSTFISIGLHVFFILVAYYGLPSFKVKEPLEQPIDIVEDTLIVSQIKKFFKDSKRSLLIRIIGRLHSLIVKKFL